MIVLIRKREMTSEGILSLCWHFVKECAKQYSWWRHQMEAFSALLALCAANSPVTVEIPSQRPVTRSFEVFFDLRLNKLLSQQSWGWCLETPSCWLWRHCNVFVTCNVSFEGRIDWNALYINSMVLYWQLSLPLSIIFTKCKPDMVLYPFMMYSIKSKA